MIWEYCNVPTVQYIRIAGPFRDWNHAEHFAQGYLQARKELEVQSPGKVKRILVNDVKGHGEFVGFPGKYVQYVPDGFYVVRAIELTAEEIATRKQQKLKAEAEEAEANAMRAVERAKKLRKAAGIS